MELISSTFPSCCELILFGDNQEGNSLQNVERFEEVIDYIASNDKRFAVHMGDAIDAFFVDDKRYDPKTCDSPPIEQANAVIDRMRPIARSKQLITVLLGNHEYELIRKAGNITKEMICKYLDVPYGGNVLKLELRDKHGLMFKSLLRHGRKRIGSAADSPLRQDANMKLQLVRQLQNVAGDCILMAKGHTHRLIVVPPIVRKFIRNTDDSLETVKLTKLDNDGGFVHPDFRWYCNTGSFLENTKIGKTGYGELLELDPLDIGCVKVLIEDRQIADIQEWVLNN